MRITGEIQKLSKKLNVQPYSFSGKERFLIKAGNRLIYKTIDDIAFLYAEGKITFLVSRDNKKYLVEYTLEELENILHPKLFFRISRKAIVHIQSIVEVKGGTKAGLEVKINQVCEINLSVSRNRISHFKKWLDW